MKTLSVLSSFESKKCLEPDEVETSQGDSANSSKVEYE